MSFSSDVKTEAARQLPEKACCRVAEAYGLLQMGHAFTGTAVSLQTENAAVAVLYAQPVSYTHLDVYKRQDMTFFLVRLFKLKKKYGIIDRACNCRKDYGRCVSQLSADNCGTFVI